jgi:hypothetical protein
VVHTLAAAHGGTGAPVNRAATQQEQETVVNPIHAIRRSGWHPCVAGRRPGGVGHRRTRRSRPGIARPGLAALLGGPATAVRLEKVPPRPDPARVHAALPGGTPAWQVTLIAASAALFAAALAVAAYGMRAARRRVTTTAA